jgi:glycosyltransferase involved in cell wall biosynthesis
LSQPGEVATAERNPLRFPVARREAAKVGFAGVAPVLSNAPLVTVVTPSHNYGGFIGQCLESVRRQTYPQIEHLVFDACSTDRTAEVLAAYADRYRLSAVIEPDEGQADALNRGFARARGEIVCWLNADDFWLHDQVVEQAVAKLKAGADVVTAGGWVVDETGRRVKPIAVDPTREVNELRFYDSFLQPATFWRRAVHRPLVTSLEYVFDWQLFLDFRAAGARFEFLEAEWAAYRMHGVNKTASDPARRRAEVAAVLRQTCGPFSPQHLWALGVYQGYRIAEAAHLPVVKQAIWYANIAMHRLTRRRVFSC